MSGVVWTDTVTPLNAANMNQLEQVSRKGAANGYASLDGTTKVPVAQLPTIPLAGITPGANGQWLKTAGGVPVWSAITPADVGLPKITVSNWASGPPGSPVDGDIWIAAVDSSGVRWMFQYNAGSASAYKWEFIGGPPISSQGAAVGNGATLNTYINIGASTLVLARGGDYRLRGGTQVTGATGGACTMVTALYLTSAANVLGFVQSVVITTANYSMSVAIPEFVATGLAAGAVVGMSGQCNGANANWNAPTFSVLPVRIG